MMVCALYMASYIKNVCNSTARSFLQFYLLVTVTLSDTNYSHVFSHYVTFQRL